MEKTGAVLQQRIVSALEKTIMPELGAHIVENFYMTPEDFEAAIARCMGRDFPLPKFYAIGLVFDIITVTRIWPICIFRQQAHPGAGILGCYVLQKW